MRLADCLELAVKNDPDAVNARDQIEIGRLKTEDASRALFLPRIDMETSYGPKLDFFGKPVSDQKIYRSQITVEKPIYKGGELVTSYKMTKSETVRAEHDYQTKATKVMAEAAKNYYDLLAAQESLRYQRELYKQGEATVDLLNEKFKLGAATKVEVLEAEAKFIEIKYKLAKAEGDLQVAIATLNKTIGWDLRMKTEVVAEFPLKPLEGKVEQFIDLALKARPDFLYQMEDSNFNQLRLELNKSKEWPTLSVAASHGWEGDRFLGQKRDWQVMLKLSLSLYDSTLSSSASQNKLYENSFNFTRQDENFDAENMKLSIFDGSSQRVSIEKARAELKLAVNRLDQLKKTVAKEVNDAFYHMKGAEANISAGEKYVMYNQEKVKVLEEKLKLKETTEVEVLKAQVDLVDAQVKTIKALYEHAAALVDLYKATGKKIEWKGNSNG
ncbi:MAG: TolC family protein [Deltaproteobacteria bacterium]|nr:TolC family protein [Deltaproteobacteria bacterium]